MHHDGPGPRELSIRSHPVSSFLHSPPPSPPKATRVPDSAAEKLSRPSAPSVIQTEIISTEDPVPFDSRPCQSSISLDATLYSSSRVSDPNATGLPTPRPSLELPETKHHLEFDDVASTLKPLLEGTAGIRELSIDGVTLDTVEELRAMSRASKLPGWERLRTDFSGDRLIVRYPTFGHEIMSTLFVRLAQDSRALPPLSGSNSTLRLGGSADVDLVDGIKSPDFSLYDNNPQKKPLTKAWPTVVWEVAYSQDEGKLANDLGRHLACSLGRVRLAIGVNIEHNHAVKGQPRSLKKVTCTFWEPDSVEEFATLEASGSPLNHLMRCDRFATRSVNYVVPAATRFSCVSEVRGRFMKFFVSKRNHYTIVPEDLAGPAALLILHKHLHRVSKAEDEDKPVITIPFSMLREVIKDHEEQQSFINISRDIKKRPRDEGDSDDDSNVEDLLGEILRLKKPRVAGDS